MPPTVRELIDGLRFAERDAYNRYQAAFTEVFQRHSGKLLAADEAPQVVEGQWDRDKGRCDGVSRRGCVLRMGGIC